jgi:hypothetical protein
VKILQCNIVTRKNRLNGLHDAVEEKRKPPRKRTIRKSKIMQEKERAYEMQCTRNTKA